MEKSLIWFSFFCVFVYFENILLWENIHNMGLSLVAQMVKNLPAMWETGIWSLSREDPLEKGMVTHSSVLTRRIPQMEATVCEVGKSQKWLSD